MNYKALLSTLILLFCCQLLVAQNCPAGTFYNGSSCVPCSPGTFSSGTGNTECTACPVGRSQSLAGQTSCDVCPPGTFQGETGQINCNNCPAGTSNPNAGAFECNDCSPGSAPNNEQTACLECPVGTFDNGSVCQPCAAGTFQDQTGQTSCNLCPLGRFQSLAGQTVCETCPPGKFQNLEGQISCQDCPAGTFQPISGAIDCTDCPEGSSSAAGSESCEVLPVELISFNGTASGSLLELNWVTAREEDFSHFVLEMATVGDFTELDQLPGTGSVTTGGNYHYLHKADRAGTHFFRLRQVDLDGTEVLSPVVTLSATRLVAKVYPNPVEGRLFVDPANTDEAVTVSVYSGSGRLIVQRIFSAGAETSLLTANWKTGVYAVVVAQGGAVEHFRVVRR